MVRLLFLAATLCIAMSAGKGALAQNVEEIYKATDKVIGRVITVVQAGPGLEKTHKWIKSYVGSTPEYEEFSGKHVWVIVRTSESLVNVGLYGATAEKGLNISEGDVVEASARHLNILRKDKEVGRVLKIICKSGSPEYVSCSKENPVSWMDKEGKKLKQPGL